MNSISHNQSKIKAQQLPKLRHLIKIALEKNKFYQKKFKSCGITSEKDIASWNDFNKIPFTTKQELINDQKENPPYGTNITAPIHTFVYLTQTSGTVKGKRFSTIYTRAGFQAALEVETTWLKLMGVNKRDRLMFALPYALYPFVADSANRLGAMLLPADGHTSYELLNNIMTLRPTVLESSPTAILNLTETAKTDGIPIQKSGIHKIILTGEIGATIPSIRKIIETAWRADCYDALGSTELSIFSFECPYKTGPHLIETNTIFEVINSSTKKQSEEGELVGTALWRKDCLFIRYRTGDFVRLNRNPCACGWQSPRLDGGIIGKVDGTLKIRATSYFPTEIERLIRKIKEINEFSISIIKENELDMLLVYIEVTPTAKHNVADIVKTSFYKYFGFEPRVIMVLPGMLPRQSWKTIRVIDKRDNPILETVPQGWYSRLITRCFHKKG